MLPIAFAARLSSLQRYLLQRVVGENVLLVILVTFGLSIIIQNGLLEVYGADHAEGRRRLDRDRDRRARPRRQRRAVLADYLCRGGAGLRGLDCFLYRSGIGAKIRAVSDDVAAADLIGLSSARIYAVAMGISFVTIGIAAGFMSIWSNFDPSAGPTRLLIAFEVIVLGGLGSMWGSLAGGIVLGVAQTIGGQFDIAWQMLAGHLVFLVVLAVRPQGLFPRY